MMRAAAMQPRILHIASWYPGPWDSIEGNFVRDQIAVFRQELPAEVVVVQVRPTPGRWPRFSRPQLEGGARGYILHAPARPGSKVLEWLSTLLLMGVLLRERAWRFSALHFHIAYPLLLHVRLWRWVLRKPIVISEHWTAYHYMFYLPEGSRALRHLRRPFEQGFAVLAVSGALLADIQAFAKRDDFKGFVLPNVVPLHGSGQEGQEGQEGQDTPTFFVVNVWRKIKNPMPMLEGLNQAALSGKDFNLVIGGYGEMLDEMVEFVKTSALRGRVRFTGKLTKPEIAAELTRSDGYLFSSNYETFSIACAEALGAGVPLIGPNIPAISEYAGPEDQVEVTDRTAKAWENAIGRFLETWKQGRWDRAAIARRAAERFSESRLRTDYRAVMRELGLGRAE